MVLLDSKKENAIRAVAFSIEIGDRGPFSGRSERWRTPRSREPPLLSYLRRGIVLRGVVFLDREYPVAEAHGSFFSKRVRSASVSR